MSSAIALSYSTEDFFLHLFWACVYGSVGCEPSSVTARVDAGSNISVHVYGLNKPDTHVVV